MLEPCAQCYDAQVVLSPVSLRHSGSMALDEIPDVLSNTLLEGIVLGKAHALVTTETYLASSRTLMLQGDAHAAG